MKYRTQKRVIHECIPFSEIPSKGVSPTEEEVMDYHFKKYGHLAGYVFLDPLRNVHLDLYFQEVDVWMGPLDNWDGVTPHDTAPPEPGMISVWMLNQWQQGEFWDCFLTYSPECYDGGDHEADCPWGAPWCWENMEDVQYAHTVEELAEKYAKTYADAIIEAVAQGECVQTETDDPEIEALERAKYDIESLHAAVKAAQEDDNYGIVEIDAAPLTDGSGNFYFEIVHYGYAEEERDKLHDLLHKKFPFFKIVKGEEYGEEISAGEGDHYTNIQPTTRISRKDPSCIE